MMRRPLLKACAWLLAVLACALPLDSMAVGSVRIPASVRRLKIPEMPETVPLFTYAQNNGKKAYTDGNYYLYFGEAVDYAAVDWVNMLEEVELNSRHTAVTSKEDHTWQQRYVIAEKDGVTVCYTNAGVPKAIWINNQEDYFLTGQNEAWATVYWRSEEIRSDCWKGPEDDLLTTWYVGNVTVSYPFGEEIRSVSVDFRNDKHNTVYGYTITYAVSDTEIYSIRYDKYDRWVRAYYSNGERNLEYICDPERGKWIWADPETGREMRRLKLRKPDSFDSPRVR